MSELFSKEPLSGSAPTDGMPGIAVIGGDRRMTFAARRLSEQGHPVTLLSCGPDGLPDTSCGHIRLAATLRAATEGAAAILLPLPATRDGERVSCPRDPAAAVPLSAIEALLSARPDLYLFGGRLPQGMTERFGGRVIDYYEDEGLQLRNAYLTAEGAVMTAMQRIDGALRGSTVAVIGYGRIGRLLTRLLRLLGADVTVAARRREALLWAEAEGCHPLQIGAPDRAGGGLNPLCYGHSVILNTVPARVLTREQLRAMEEGTVFIDLASAPFGVSDEDVRAMAECGVCYLREPSIPGTYAPRDAGYIIADVVSAALAEQRRRIAKGGE